MGRPILTDGAEAVNLGVMFRLVLIAFYFASIFGNVAVIYRQTIHSRAHIPALHGASLHYRAESELLRGAVIQPVLQDVDFAQKNDRVDLEPFSWSEGYLASGPEDFGSPRLSRSEVAQNSLPTPLQLFEIFTT